MFRPSSIDGQRSPEFLEYPGLPVSRTCQSKIVGTLATFNVRQPIHSIPIPLLPEDGEPDLDLGAVFHALYDRARFDLRLNYAKPPVPPLKKEVVDWARPIVESARSN